jgi:NADPH:quinone reductase-like Zn-dependent oxidoreductase
VRLEGLSEGNAATMMVHVLFPNIFDVEASLALVTIHDPQVNPATVHCLLSHFVTLERGQSVVQNGANGAVRHIGALTCAMS